MYRSQLENLYKANGLRDSKLRNTEDLLKIHETIMDTIGLIILTGSYIKNL